MSTDVIELTSLRVRGPRGETTLSALDLDVVGYFAAANGRVVMRDDLLRDVWGRPEPERFDTRVVDVRIAKVRRALETAFAEAPIKTIRGSGYRLSMEPASRERLLDIEVVLLPCESVMAVFGSLGLFLAWAKERRRLRGVDLAEHGAPEGALSPGGARSL